MVKRVLHFQGRMGLGGAESFMMNIFRKIDRKKFQFDFLIYDDYENVRDYNDEIKQLGGRIFVVANPKRNILKYLWQVNRLLKKEQFDIVHNEVYFGGGINLLLAKKNGVKRRIAHSHATEDGKSTSFLFNILRLFLNKLLLDNATDFLAVSKEAGDSLFQGHAYEIVHNGIDISLYQNQRVAGEKIRRSLGISQETFVVGNIGRLENQKNQMLLIQIFNELQKQQPNSILLIIGDGSLRKQLQSEVVKLNLEKKVLFLGERNDIPALLASLNVFVMTSIYEGLPMVGLEAQAAGLKLVLSNTISKDTKLTPNVLFVDLKANLNSWVNQILIEPFGNKETKELDSYDVSYTTEQMVRIYERK